MGIVAWYLIFALIMIPVFFGFWFLYGIYKDTRPDKMKAVLVDQNKQVSVHRVTLDPTRKSFRIKGDKPVTKYMVVESAVVRTGMFRVPTSYYIHGRVEPINLLEMRAESSFSAVEFEEATEAHVAQDIISAFSNPALTPTTTMLLLVLVMVVALGFVWYDLSESLTAISDVLGINAVDESGMPQ